MDHLTAAGYFRDREGRVYDAYGPAPPDDARGREPDRPPPRKGRRPAKAPDPGRRRIARDPGAADGP